MKVLITGPSYGMGHEIALRFLEEGHEVHGLDLFPCDIVNENYTHYICDVSDMSTLPDIEGIQILINNAGMQDSGKDIKVNLIGTMNCTKKYALNNIQICSVLNQAAAGASNGLDFPDYVASKGGVVAYTKWAAKEIAKYGATCNSLSFGGVYIDSNYTVIEDPEKWDKIMKQTPLEKWTTVDEVADWVYFMTMYNKSCSGQDIVIDNLESLNGEFIWN